MNDKIDLRLPQDAPILLCYRHWRASTVPDLFWHSSLVWNLKSRPVLSGTKWWFLTRSITYIRVGHSLLTVEAV